MAFCTLVRRIPVSMAYGQLELLAALFTFIALDRYVKAVRADGNYCLRWLSHCWRPAPRNRQSCCLRWPC